MPPRPATAKKSLVAGKQRNGEKTMEEKKLTPIKAIRAKCLDCCCGNSNEVKLCTVERCALWPYREGHNPYIAKRELTDEQRAEIGKRLAEKRMAVTVANAAN
nr:MAG TPA: hypothetical protein [Caudoviricetes sp.]